jgi:hypothetical protein
MFGAIGFESEENKLRKLRERLRLMSDEELNRFGRSVRNLVRAKRVSATPNSWCTVGGGEWKRRHPKV